MPLTQAENYLNNLDSNIWIPFSDIPKEIFHDVWEIIENNPNILIHNDEDIEKECFKKVHFEIKNLII